jgi:hypothetical protein
LISGTCGKKLRHGHISIPTEAFEVARAALEMLDIRRKKLLQEIDKDVEVSNRTL